MRILAWPKLSDANFLFSEVETIVLANEHGRPIAMFNGSVRWNKFIYCGREVFSSDRVHMEKIQTLLLQYHGTPLSWFAFTSNGFLL